VVDAQCFVVDVVEQAVRTAAGTEQAGKFAIEGLPTRPGSRASSPNANSMMTETMPWRVAREPCQ